MSEAGIIEIVKMICLTVGGVAGLIFAYYFIKIQIGRYDD
jgi:hypothetical protein